MLSGSKRDLRHSRDGGLLHFAFWNCKALGVFWGSRDVSVLGTTSLSLRHITASRLYIDEHPNFREKATNTWEKQFSHNLSCRRRLTVMHIG